MDWVLRSPQIHSTFSNLGFVQIDGYHVNENCNSALETILNNIITEDKYLLTYRRSISFGQNINKDLIPLLLHAKEDKTVELIVKILVNLTIPIECLLNVDLISRTDHGRYTIFELNNLLASIKVAFTDIRTSKALVDYLKKNVDDAEQKTKLSEEQRINVTNCLLLLRNVLHIPEDNSHLSASYSSSVHSIQNQILWNIFSQSFDKIILKSMSILDANFWGVTMVQLVALLYKDQHVVILHKLLNNWFDASFSESSEDNESNTSPPDRDSEDSLPMLPSDPTSDSSDNGAGDKCGDSATSMYDAWEPEASTQEQRSPTCPPDHDNLDDDKSATSQHDEQYNSAEDKSSRDSNTNEDQAKLCAKTPTFITNTNGRDDDQSKEQKQIVISDSSDSDGYRTYIENYESISTSSNEDDLPTKKPVHQKPHNVKKRPNNKPRNCVSTQDRKRLKTVKRGKANIINIQGLSHKMPTDDDISNVLKEFTVDFLLKGYNSLVHTLHSEILTNPQLQIDTSHFFWLLSYFLKFATQIELDLEHLKSVLSFEILSYLTSEGVNLCEQFELAIKLDSCDLSPTIRRLHLAVTAIREFVQAIEVYKRKPYLDEDTREILKKLQIKMCETDDLRSMLVLLLRHFNPKYHSKQYLQDLIVTNHILLEFLYNVIKLPDYNCSTKFIDHIRQFATPKIMAQYGLLLSDYRINGEYVNECIFTMMHHVGGEVDSLKTLFQPSILKTFTAVWKSDFKICDDWFDIMQFVIQAFVRNPKTLNNDHLGTNYGLDQNELFARPIEIMSTHSKDVHPDTSKTNILTDATLDRWTEVEISALSWNYLQSNTKIDVIDIITEKLKDDGIDKTRVSVIRELFRQNLISKDLYESQLKGESDKNMKTASLSPVTREEEIGQLCKHLIQDGKSTCLDWVQKVLLEICYAKIHIQKIKMKKTAPVSKSKLQNFKIFRIKHEESPVVSPIAYHALIMQEPVPLVPWNCHHSNICKDLKFLQLVHKLGFHMPVDTGKVFIRIPNFWTPEFIFRIAETIRPVDPSKLKFSVSELSDSEIFTKKGNNAPCTIEDEPMIAAPDVLYQIYNQNQATMVNFTPRPSPTFKPEGETGLLNWLQVVKKSQETKMVLNLESISAEPTEDIVTKVPAMEVASHPFTAPAPRKRPRPARPVPSPRKRPRTLRPVPATIPAKAEIFNSASEKASVASDLTCMYVSDEDEKAEVIVHKEKSSRVNAKISGKRRREN